MIQLQRSEWLVGAAIKPTLTIIMQPSVSESNRWSFIIRDLEAGTFNGGCYLYASSSTVEHHHAGYAKVKTSSSAWKALRCSHLQSQFVCLSSMDIAFSSGAWYIEKWLSWSVKQNDSHYVRRLQGNFTTHACITVQPDWTVRVRFILENIIFASSLELTAEVFSNRSACASRQWQLFCDYIFYYAHTW